MVIKRLVLVGVAGGHAHAGVRLRRVRRGAAAVGLPAEARQRGVRAAAQHRRHHRYAPAAPLRYGPLDSPGVHRVACRLTDRTVCAELVEACALVGVDADALGEALGACAADDEDAPLDAGEWGRWRGARGVNSDY